jgi:hypothetical protein
MVRQFGSLLLIFPKGLHLFYLQPMPVVDALVDKLF